MANASGDRHLGRDRNIFCRRSHLTNEASVETWFVDRLLAYLDFTADDVLLKTSIQEFKVGHGSRASLYRPDYVVKAAGFPAIVIDAKHPTEDLEPWVQQCSSYCLELNKLYEFNPVEYFLLTNGLDTRLYRWDQGQALLALDFDDFYVGSHSLAALADAISKDALQDVESAKRDGLLDEPFELRTISMEEMGALFGRLHQYTWEAEKKTPSAALEELIKIVFIKIKKDRELRARIGTREPKVKDVTFSVAWIQNQTEHDHPINDPLFKNLVADLDREIHRKNKRRIFDTAEQIRLSQATVLKIVRDLEHIDFFQMDEDIHGRMFESFLDATVRGKALGQYFTPRDVVTLMVQLADIQVTRDSTETVLDACCGSGGFLLTAMSDMLAKARRLAGLSNQQLSLLERQIANRSIVGIDAGSDPPIYRIARMNMYLHGDGGSNIYFADAIDKNIGQVGHTSVELEGELADLRDMIINRRAKFDVILSNPPFSMKYSRDHREQRDILNQYDIGGYGRQASSLLSSVLFLERYRELVTDDGRILAVIDESILSGESYRNIRDYIRKVFIIIGVVSLPGDAFRRSEARVKTSVLILRRRLEGEAQPDIFMDRSVYLGLTPKSARRIGISASELEQGRPRELQSIVANFRAFTAGKHGEYVVPASRINDRLDVKFCLNDRERGQARWKASGRSVAPLNECLEEVTDRAEAVDDGSEYRLVKVTYDGDVVESERKSGEELSYATLYRVNTWDVLFSNMGVGRGAIGIVPDDCDGCYVSSEYTILMAKSHQEAVFYTRILRTREVLVAILSSATGMNRGRMHWDEVGKIPVPQKHDDDDAGLRKTVQALEASWSARRTLEIETTGSVGALVEDLELDSPEARLRWLAYKPPE